MKLRLATRTSPLALWQARHVSALLTETQPDLEIEMVAIETSADKRLDLPISQIGGKGAFSSQVQELVGTGAADFAVHSGKDLPSTEADGSVLVAFPERGDPRDCLVGSRLSDLKPGSTVATGSARRRVQLQQLRPDLEFHELRGNIGTRLKKAEGFDAIVMAYVALTRLGESPAVVEVLEVDQMIPQVAQGALAVECRSDDQATIQLLSAIDHPPTREVVEAERAFLIELGGDCDLPAGAHAVRGSSGAVEVTGLLADDAGRVLTHVEIGMGASVGARVAATLRRRLDE